METTPRGRQLQDWAVLKYGWLFILMVHIVFLAAGVREIKSAIEMFDPALLDPSERRLDHVMQALYMWTLAFSIILMVLSVFVMEIFRSQRKILQLLTLQQRPAEPPPPTNAGS